MRRSIALISVVDPSDAAETVAHALHSRQAAVGFFRDAIAYLEPPAEPTLFDDPEDPA